MYIMDLTRAVINSALVRADEPLWNRPPEAVPSVAERSERWRNAQVGSRMPVRRGVSLTRRVQKNGEKSLIMDLIRVTRGLARNRATFRLPISSELFGYAIVTRHKRERLA